MLPAPPGKHLPTGTLQTTNSAARDVTRSDHASAPPYAIAADGRTFYAGHARAGHGAISGIVNATCRGTNVICILNLFLF